MRTPSFSCGGFAADQGAQLVGLECEGVQARLGTTGGCLCTQQPLCWCCTPLLSVYLCPPVAELCLLPSRGSGCRTLAWMWLTSSPPMVSSMSSARYGSGRVCTGNPVGRPRDSDTLISPHAPCQVLLPPREDVLGGTGLLQQLDSVPAFHLFRELLQVRTRGKGECVVRGALSLVRRELVGFQGHDWGQLYTSMTPAPCS